MMSIKQRIEKIEKLQAIEAPWAFKRIFGNLEILGNQVAMQDAQGDFVSIEEMQTALNWLIKELGGSVTWED